MKNDQPALLQKYIELRHHSVGLRSTDRHDSGAGAEPLGRPSAITASFRLVDVRMLLRSIAEPPRRSRPARPGPGRPAPRRPRAAQSVPASKKISIWRHGAAEPAERPHQPRRQAALPVRKPVARCPGNVRIRSRLTGAEQRADHDQTEPVPDGAGQGREDQPAQDDARQHLAARGGRRASRSAPRRARRPGRKPRTPRKIAWPSGGGPRRMSSWTCMIQMRSM